MTHPLDDLTDEQRANAKKWAESWLTDPGAPNPTGNNEADGIASVLAKALLTALEERDAARETSAMYVERMDMYIESGASMWPVVIAARACRDRLITTQTGATRFTASVTDIVEATHDMCDAVDAYIASSKPNEYGDFPRDIWEQRCLDLLARVHRDGGHYVGVHGIDKALADADQIVANLNVGAAAMHALDHERGAAMRAGIEQCINIVRQRQRYYELYREPGAMQTKPATFAILDEVQTFLGAYLERTIVSTKTSDANETSTGRKP